MNCNECIHAEMCKWIDELEGRGCDFLSQGQISLNDINNALEASFRNGVRSAKVEREGKWIDYQKNGWIYAQCSECGEVHDSPSDYCPSCGAKMEREDKE